MSNTHLINGFYKEPSNANTDQFYRHGPFYANPDNSPYMTDGPRVYKSDRHSFFNGKVFTIRDVPKSVSTVRQAKVLSFYMEKSFRQPVSRPASAAEGRALFEPPAPAPKTIEQRYLNDRFSVHPNK